MERTKPPKTNGQVMVNSKTLHNLGALLGRAALAARMGYQYGTDRDLYQALGYPTTNIQYSEFASRYERQDIAKAIINRPVSYTWKGPITLKIIGQEESEIGRAWKELDKRLQLRSKFVRLDKLSCIGRYGVLLLGFDDVTDREGFRRPVNKDSKNLLYVKPLGEGHAKIQRFVKNTKDPRYGLPEEYEIEYTENDSETVVTLYAHWTRVLHVTSELLESEVYGVPVLQAVYNRLMDLEKLVGGSAEMFWRGARPGYQGKVKEDYTLPTDVENGLQDQLDEFEHNLRRVFVNEGVDLEALATQVSDPANHVDVQIQMIAAVTGIPKRILTGSERGELSSAQDIIAWFSYIQTRREEHAEINILRPFVQKCMQHGVLPVSEDYVVQWSDLFASSEKDKAEVGRIRAMAVREYTTNPMAESLIPPKAFFRLFLGLSEDEQAEIEKMSSEEIMEELRRIAEAGETREVAEEPVNVNNE